MGLNGLLLTNHLDDSALTPDSGNQNVVIVDAVVTLCHVPPFWSDEKLDFWMDQLQNCSRHSYNSQIHLFRKEPPNRQLLDYVCSSE